MTERTTTKKTWLLLASLLVLGVVGWQFALDGFRDQEKALRSELRQELQSRFPQQAAEAAARFGLHPFVDGLPLHSRQVVLIHGLDDPGKVWMNLAPALTKAGFGVWIMSYPDDQPIEESARLLRGEMRQLRKRGVEQVDIVAHSMGGLVSRELLTGLADEGLAIPVVDRLIMVGTPNHGSEMARFRAFAEWRDQFTEMVNGDFLWLGWIFDGAGEAGIDLIPGSRFLQRLNARPNPPHTRLTVIAAVLGQLEQQRLDQQWAQLIGDPQLRQLNGALAMLQRVSETLGDGLVTVESARLEGADFLLVEGSHLSMIRNVLESSGRIPPAVPLIVERLGPAQASTSMP